MRRDQIRLFEGALPGEESGGGNKQDKQQQASRYPEAIAGPGPGASGDRTGNDDQGGDGDELQDAARWQRVQGADGVEQGPGAQTVGVGDAVSEVGKRVQGEKRKANTAPQKKAASADQKVLDIDVAGREKRKAVRDQREHQAQQEQIDQLR